MTALWKLVGCALLLPFAAAGQNAGVPAESQQSEHEQHAQSPGGEPPGEQSMAAMHEHMQTMREQMARIHAAQDPDERQRLMQEHMQSMQQHMQMMGRMGGEPDRATRCAQGDMACRMQEMQAQSGMMQQRMRTMQDRLESMEQLLQQMLDHLRENETQGAAQGRERDRRR